MSRMSDHMYELTRAKFVFCQVTFGTSNDSEFVVLAGEVP